MTHKIFRVYLMLKFIHFKRFYRFISLTAYQLPNGYLRLKFSEKLWLVLFVEQNLNFFSVRSIFIYIF